MAKMIRPVQNIDAALKAYYGNGYINNRDIKAIFQVCDSSAWKMAKSVREESAKRDIPIIMPGYINVKIAFELWGINVKELEQNKRKIANLNLC